MKRDCFGALILAVTATIQIAAAGSTTRCGTSWIAANSSCGLACVFVDAPCVAEATNLLCYANLSLSPCETDTTSITAAISTSSSSTSASSVSSASTSTASATNDRAAAAIAIINELPTCGIKCITNGATTVTDSIAIQFCQEELNNELNVTQLTSCLASSCSATDSTATTTALTSNTAQLISACKSLVSVLITSSTASITVTGTGVSNISITAPSVNSNSGSGSNVNVGLVVGLIVGLLAFWIIVFAFFYWFRKNRKAKKAAEEEELARGNLEGGSELYGGQYEDTTSSVAVVGTAGRTQQPQYS
ncbi:hypothetical protein HK100_012305 [Physocladia obscura]|uniref:Extracellular membrane protein CFEM domain-containing protein n=1 Tax=Physocladia obscura TaxID=109957 RepID=A0AAD5T0I9_9FUNG|nr:hypothetical protein HK100_012305 [Physocladia obscura]